MGAKLKSLCNGMRESDDIFIEKRILTLCSWQPGTSNTPNIAKGQSNDRRHGYVYTYPGSFQASA